MKREKKREKTYLGSLVPLRRSRGYRGIGSNHLIGKIKARNNFLNLFGCVHARVYSDEGYQLRGQPGNIKTRIKQKRLFQILYYTREKIESLRVVDVSFLSNGSQIFFFFLQ